MKKIILIIFLFPTILLSQVRNTNWGFTKEQVKKVEKLTFLSESADDIYYEGSIGGNKCAVVYSFIKNKLATIVFLYSEKHINKNLYIEDYKTLCTTLRKKYPRFDGEDVLWNNELFKDDPSSIGFACSMGYVKFRTFIGSETTEIIVGCKGDNLEIQVYVVYRDRKYFAENDSEISDKMLSEY